MKKISSHVNLATIKNLRDLQVQGEPDVLKELVGIFFSTSSHRIVAILDAIMQKNSEILKSTVHTLKSSAATLGAEAMAKICIQIENFEEGEGSDVLFNLFLNLKKEYAAVQKELKKITAD